MPTLAARRRSVREASQLFQRSYKVSAKIYRPQQLNFSDKDDSRGRNNLDRRPAPPDHCRQLQTVHRARHLDVGEDDCNVQTYFEDFHCFISVRRFDDIKIQPLQSFRRRRFGSESRPQRQGQRVVLRLYHSFHPHLCCREKRCWPVSFPSSMKDFSGPCPFGVQTV
jgi:hypothetical protein